jgi:DNA repair exonuclease SbcCD ATPase subunit
MNIRFKKLKLHNFLSFGDAELSLSESGYTLVSGKNNCKDDLAKSNGSGKSSIWESIVWCLTGETIRGTKDIVNRFTTGGAFVELDFNIDEDNYKIIRYKEYTKIGTNLKIFINDVDKSGKGIRDSEKLLTEYLPDLTSSLIGSVIILGQGLPQRFTNNTPSGRKEVLEKLSKSDFMIEDIKNKLSDRKNYLNNELRKFEDKILSLESKKSVIQSQLEKDENFLKEQPFIDFVNEYADYDINISFLKNNINLHEAHLKESEVKGKEISEKYNKFDLDFKDFQLANATAYNEKIDPIVKQRIENQFKITQLNKDIANAKSVKDICPTCGQKLPNIHKIDTTDMEQEVSRLTQLNNELNETVQSLKKESCEKEDEFKIAQDLERQSVKDMLDKARQEYKDILADKDKDVAELHKKELELENLKNLESRLKTINDTIEQYKEQLSKISQEILYNIIERDNFKLRVETVNKIFTIATRDFRGFLLSSIIEFIQIKAKEYSKEIFDNENITFKLDGNNIYIGYNDKQYENLSGGEKQKIDLIVQFAIRDMLSKYWNFNSNILVLDEIFDNLDDIGCQRVLNLIANKLINIESIFIITHHSDIFIPYDNEISIIKDNNISRLE